MVGILDLDSNIGLVFMMDPVVCVAAGFAWSMRFSEFDRDDLISYWWVVVLVRVLATGIDMESDEINISLLGRCDFCLAML